MLLVTSETLTEGSGKLQSIQSESLRLKEARKDGRTMTIVGSTVFSPVTHLLGLKRTDSRRREIRQNSGTFNSSLVR